jgi:hypothetical protein
MRFNSGSPPSLSAATPPKYPRCECMEKYCRRYARGRPWVGYGCDAPPPGAAFCFGNGRRETAGVGDRPIVMLGLPRLPSRQVAPEHYTVTISSSSAVRRAGSKRSKHWSAGCLSIFQPLYSSRCRFVAGAVRCPKSCSGWQPCRRPTPAMVSASSADAFASRRRIITCGYEDRRISCGKRCDAR